MYCPFCGGELALIERNTKAEKEEAYMEWQDDDFRGDPPEVDESEHWECHNTRCNLRSPCYFNLHHPFRGPNSKPGDSWSISWIK